MTGPFEVWRRTLWLWVAPLVFCVVNLIVLAVYFQVYSGRVETLTVELEESQARFERYRTERGEIEEFLGRLDQQQEQVKELYVEHFQTEEERFTAAIREVKRLARDAGLQPSNLAYPGEDSSTFGLAGRDINFQVDGTYRQVRTFINFLELSDHFLTLREVGLTGVTESNRREPTLGIRLRVSTYFHSQELALSEDAREETES